MDIRQKFIGIASDVFLPVIKFYWYIFRPKIYGVKCIVECGGEILLVRHTYGKRLWTFPGGSISKKESPENAIRREVREELGIIADNFIKNGEILDESEFVKDFITIFSLKVNEKNMKFDKNEILEAAWYNSENLPKLSDVTQKILSFQKKYND